jgi:small-conductance mechanosensitive channel
MINETIKYSVLGQTFSFARDLFEGFFAKIVVALVILLVGFILGKFVGKVVKKLMSEIEINNILGSATGVNIRIEEIISGFLTYFIYFLTIITALNQLGLTTTILNMLSAAVIVIIIISVFLALKDFIPNAFSGFFIFRNAFLKEGDWIKFKGIEGKITQINLLETKVETKNRDILFIPNSALTKTEVVKMEFKKRAKKKTSKKKKS